MCCCLHQQGIPVSVNVGCLLSAFVPGQVVAAFVLRPRLAGQGLRRAELLGEGNQIPASRPIAGGAWVEGGTGGASAFDDVHDIVFQVF